MNNPAQRYHRLRSDPDAALVLHFCPATAREKVAPVMALQRELLAMPDEITEPEVLQAKLAWWLQELSRCAEGRPTSHPLAREIQQGWPDFAWIGWQRAVTSLLQQAGETGSATQAQLHAYRLEQGGAIWQAWLLGRAAAPNRTIAAQGAMLQLVDALRRDRGRLRWIGLDRLARFQCRRSDLEASIAAGKSDAECVKLLRELADDWLEECQVLLHEPPSHGGGAAAVLVMQLRLAQLWLRALRRKPLAFLGGHFRPSLLRRLHAAWRAAGQHRRRHGH